MKCNICGNEMVEGALEVGYGECFWMPKNFPLSNMLRKKFTKHSKIPEELVMLKYEHYFWGNKSRMKAYRCKQCQAIILLENDLEYEDKNLYL